jgi:hypothetical protein
MTRLYACVYIAALASGIMGHQTINLFAKPSAVIRRALGEHNIPLSD